MTSFLEIVGAVVSIALLYYGADFLVDGGVAIARRMKISSLVIGLTLVSFATSAPELVVSLVSTLEGHGDVALGNATGSNICNIGLILGLSAVIAPLPVNRKLLKLDMPLMLAASLLLTLFFWLNQGVNRWQGALFFAGVIAYTVWSVIASRREGVPESDAGGEVEIKEVNTWLSVLLVAGGLLMLTFGARFFVNCATFIAGRLGVPEAIVALTVVALGTSLPELATSVVAALKHEQDIAIGNVVGSNIFNILCIMGASPLVKPVTAPGLRFFDFGIMLLFAAVLYVMMLCGKKINRAEGALLLAMNCVYTGILVARAL